MRNIGECGLHLRKGRIMESYEKPHAASKNGESLKGGIRNVKPSKIGKCGGWGGWGAVGEVGEMQI